jgi:hypothetical protein
MNIDSPEKTVLAMIQDILKGIDWANMTAREKQISNLVYDVLCKSKSQTVEESKG